MTGELLLASLVVGLSSGWLLGVVIGKGQYGMLGIDSDRRSRRERLLFSLVASGQITLRRIDGGGARLPACSAETP